MDHLSLNLAAAGLLTSMSRLPSVFNPIIGYIADKKGARYFVILAPALTATLMSLIGSANSVIVLGILLFLSGLSSTLFHASSPGLVAQASDDRKGRGLSLYMAGGGIGRATACSQAMSRHRPPSARHGAPPCAAIRSPGTGTRDPVPRARV